MSLKVLVSLLLPSSLLLLLLACQGGRAEKKVPPIAAPTPSIALVDEAPSAGSKKAGLLLAQAGPAQVPAAGPAADAGDGDSDSEDVASPSALVAKKKRRAEVDTGPRSAVEIAVKRGESMGLYGRWAKVAMPALYRRAKLAWGMKLAVGRTLRIELTAKERARFEEGRAAFARAREGAFAKVATEEYVVLRGDSGWRIARRRGVPLDVLERLNPAADMKRLQVGDKLKVPAKGGES